MFIREDDDKDTSEDTSKDTGKETDDSSEEDDTSSEDDTSEDTESDGDDSESTEDESGDDEEDTISKKYFADPSSIPKELRASFKKMQGIFTRKMQEASGNIRKAQAFDQLIVDPEFRAWMEERAAKMSGKELPKKKTGNSNKGNEEDDDDNKPLTRKDFQEMQRKQQAQEQVKLEFRTFVKENPDYKLYETRMKELLDEVPNLSYQRAYDLASMEDRKSSRKKEDMDSKKRANTMKPKGTAKEPDKKKGKMTFQEAFDLAKKTVGLGKKG